MLPYVGGDRNRFAEQLFTPLPDRYDRLAELLSMGQNGRWRRAMIDRVVVGSAQTVLDVASGTAGVALNWPTRTSADVVGVDLTMGMLEQGRQNIDAAGMSKRVQLVAVQGRAASLRRPHVRRSDLHLSPALCGRSQRDSPRARPGRQTRRNCGKPRILRSAECCLAFPVVALHSPPSPGCRLDHRRTGLVSCRPIPGAQHLRSLPEVSPLVDRGRLALGRICGRRRPSDESRGWAGDVGSARR